MVSDTVLSSVSLRESRLVPDRLVMSRKRDITAENQDGTGEETGAFRQN